MFKKCFRANDKKNMRFANNFVFWSGEGGLNKYLDMLSTLSSRLITPIYIIYVLVLLLV